MIKFIKDQKYHVLIFLFGALLILLAFFEIKDLKKFELITRNYPFYTLFITGLLFTFLSVVLFLHENLSDNFYSGNKIQRIKNGFTVLCSNSRINLIFGKIEKVADTLNESLVILPANEFFDDECINDKKSSLGAFINDKFPNQSEQILSMIKDALKNNKSSEVEKEEGVRALSYGVGTGILLKKPSSVRLT